ncbi:MAG: tetratricopeptide repeat protein [Thermodesulfobacteriota bacterium]
MSEQSAFDQNQVAEGAYAEPSGILDQLNLPAGVVAFLRKNQRMLQITGLITVVLVVTISLYTSYRTSRLEKAASALSLAMTAEGDAKNSGLQQVVTDFDGTPSALWATAEMGHMAMKSGDYANASKLYSQAREKIAKSSPMYGLLTFGMAQAAEAGKDYQAASASYAGLKEIEGYSGEGYMGMGRVLEAQGNSEKAIAIYEEYLATFSGESQNLRITNMLQEKITRLRIQ